MVECVHLGVPDVKLAGLHSEVTVRCVPLGSQKFRCTYTPSAPGNLLTHPMLSIVMLLYSVVVSTR